MVKINKLTSVALLGAAVLMTGCAKQTFVMQGGTGVVAEEGSSTFFISGLGQSDVINAGEICGGASRVVSVEAELSAIDGVLGSLSSGIYTPRTYRVTCRA